MGNVRWAVLSLVRYQSGIGFDGRHFWRARWLDRDRRCDGGRFAFPGVGEGRLKDGVVASSRRVAGSYVDGVEEAVPFPFVLGFFLPIPCEVGEFLLGLEAAQAWPPARA